MAQTRLKQLREEAVLTVHELAEASGVSDDTISKIENGQRVARPSTLRKLALALDVSPQELRRPLKVEEPVPLAKAPGESGPPEDTSKVTLEQLHNRGIPANNSEVIVLNQYLEFHERPPAGPYAIGYVVKEGEPVDHDRVKTMLAYVLASGMLTEEETEAVRDVLHDELVGTER
jgi:transcriptional regulator with XRE-family HTH domain